MGLNWKVIRREAHVSRDSRQHRRPQPSPLPAHRNAGVAQGCGGHDRLWDRLAPSRRPHSARCDCAHAWTSRPRRWPEPRVAVSRVRASSGVEGDRTVAHPRAASRAVPHCDGHPRHHVRGLSGRSFAQRARGGVSNHSGSRIGVLCAGCASYSECGPDARRDQLVHRRRRFDRSTDRASRTAARSGWPHLNCASARMVCTSGRSPSHLYALRAGDRCGVARC
jgi:hypothetical protein